MIGKQRGIERWGSLLLVVAFGAIPAFGQRNGFRFSEPLAISSGFDDVAQTNTISPAPILFVDAGVSYLKVAPGKPSFAATYRPELQVLMKGRNNVRWNHALDLAYDQPFGMRSGFGAGYAFIDTSDPARMMADNVFALPLSEFREHAAAATVYRALTRRNIVSARVDASMTDVSGLRRATGLGVSQDAMAGTVSVSRRLNERQTLSAAYSLIRFSPYTFENNVAAVNFLPSVPTVRGGISRYAALLAGAAANQSAAPTGLLGGTRVLDFTTPDVTSFPAIGGVVEAAPGIPAVTDLEVFSHPFHAVSLTYARAWRADLLVDVTGGAMRDTETSYLFRMEVRKRIDRVWLAAEFEHYPSNFAPLGIEGLPSGEPLADLSPSWSNFSVFGFSVDGLINPTTELSVGTTYSRGTAKFLEDSTSLWVVGARVDHWLSERYGVFATAESFSEHFAGSLFVGDGRQRVLGGIQILLDPPIH